MAIGEEVSILVGGTRLKFWDTVRIVRTMDQMDVAGFGSPFDSTGPGLRDILRPLTYPEMEVTVGGDPLFTGVATTIDPVLENTRRMIEVGAYSSPGVLNDCTAPASSFPLEYDGLTLRGIAEDVVSPFGLEVDFRGDPGPVFGRVALSPGKKVLAFLIELAKQRDFIISSNGTGGLLFWRSVSPGSPVVRLRQGESPLISVVPQFSPQDYYSHITGIEPAVVGLPGSQFTVKNPKLEGVLRPLTFGASDALSANVEGAVKAKLGRMFGNVVSYKVRVDTWRDPSGALWSPNTTVKLTAPDAMVYQEYEFIIRSVELERNRAEEVATLGLVLPGAFSGEAPEALPWD